MNMNHPNIERILNFPRIPQRTEEWFSYRKNRVTASEVSIILAQGKGAKSLMLKKKMGGGSSFSTEYTRIGTDNEELIVEKYKKLYPDVVVYHDLSIVPHKTHSFIAASLDACTNTGINVEIKTCFKDKHVKVCKAYRDQVQLQMEVADLELTHLVQEYYNMPGKPIVVHEIKRDRSWFEKSCPIIEKFVQDLDIFFPFDLVMVNYQMERFKSLQFHVTSEFSFDLERIKNQFIKNQIAKQK